MQEQEQKPLLHDTWVNLLRLTGENITDDMLPAIMKELKVSRLDELTERQANIVIDALRPLARVKGLLWDGILEAIEKEQSKPGRKLSKVDAMMVADLVVPAQMDRLAKIFILEVQRSLFDPSQV